MELNFPIWDTQLFLYLNSLHSPLMDSLMWLISGKLTWIPLYLLLLYMLWRQEPKWQKILIVIAGIGLTILIADQISSGFFKGFFQRLRPTHQPEIAELIHTVKGYRGGLYGFVSSHSANAFGIAIFVSLLLEKRYYTITLLLWATIVAYSRIYLGVHYPLDIIVGALIGAIGGYIGALFVILVTNKFLHKGENIKLQ